MSNAPDDAVLESSRRVFITSAQAARAIPLIVVLGVFGLFLQSERSTDVWHHIKSGWVVSRSGPAHTDVFSCTAGGKPYIQYEWLAQYVIYAVWNSGGIAGLVLFRAGAAAAAAALLLMACRRRAGATPLSAAVAVLLAFCGASIRPYSRPEMFTWICLAALILAVQRLRRPSDVEGKTPGFFPAALIPAFIMIPWVNLHGAWVSGLVWLGIVCACDTLSCLWGRPGVVNRSRLALLWSALGLMCAATLCNPYGVHIWEVPYNLTTMPELYEKITEWMRPHASDLLDPRYVGLFVLPIAVLLAPMRLAVTDALILLAFGALSLTAVRHIVLLIFITAPIVAGQLGAGASRFGPWLKRLPEEARPRTSVAVCILVWIGLLAATQGGFSMPRAGIGLVKEKYPIGAADFLRANRLEGNLFNSYEYGNYLLFALYPNNHVFIDGRIDMYGPGPVKLYDRVITLSPDWRKILADYSIDLCVLPTNREKRFALIGALQNDPEWALVYWDNVSAVYVRRSPRREEFLKSAYIYTVNPDLYKGRANLPPEFWKRAAQDYRHKLEEDPGCTVALQGLAECLQREGDYRGAAELLSKALDQYPDNPAFCYNLGAVYLYLDQLDDSRHYLEKALRLGGDRADCYAALTLCAQKQGDLRLARRYAESAVKYAPGDWQKWWNLSVIAESLGDLRPALRAMEEALRVMPENPNAQQEVRRLQQKLAAPEGGP